MTHDNYSLVVLACDTPGTADAAYSDTVIVLTCTHTDKYNPLQWRVSDFGLPDWSLIHLVYCKCKLVVWAHHIKKTVKGFPGI